MNKKVIFYLCIAVYVMLTACEKDRGPLPVALFTTIGDSMPAPATVAFQNVSEHATSYLWDFGDYATSTLENPEHTFNSKGYYHVNLTATGPGGSNSYYKVITILDPANIIPGERAGEFYVGETWGSIITKVHSSMYLHAKLMVGSYYYHLCRFESDGVSFFFRTVKSTIGDSDQVLVISVFYPFVGFTEKGITLGSKVTEVLSAYGQPDSEEYSTLYYNTLGIDFGYDDRRNLIEDISVSAPSQTKSLSTSSAEIREKLSLQKGSSKSIAW